MAKYIEYIDREAVKEMLQKYRCLGCTNEKSLDCPLCQLHRLFAEINKIPAADVVEIVRGGDYVHRDPEDNRFDYGERRKENGEIY